MHYFIILVVLVILELVYFKIADRFNIIDKPNHRSSHTSITLRGGGIIFPVAMLIACFLGDASLWFTIAVLVVGMVSFIDDIRPLPTIPRFGAHILATVLLSCELGLFDGNLWFLPIIFIGMIGWINAFNFMDGINGITVLYAFVSILCFAYLFQNDSIFELLLIMGLACVVFGFFNVRKKAKTFAGDVGSVSMAVFLGYMMLKAIFEYENGAYILLFSVYGIDAAITILYRLKNKENIFQPHRSHLYQYLANEMGWSHLKVSFLYAVVQLFINILAIYLISKYEMNWLGTGGILIVFSVAYWLIRSKVKNKIMA